MIFGLPLSLFALMMIGIIGSLLVIIFSFSFKIIVTVFILIAALYICFTSVAANPQMFQFSKVFPQIISNKKCSLINYEED